MGQEVTASEHDDHRASAGSEPLGRPAESPYGPIRVGVSRCLLGDAVRYDGGRRRHAWLVDIVGPLVEWVPVCPEVELGMGTPREPIQLVRSGDDVRLVGVDSRTDHTEAMQSYAKARVEQLAGERLRGFILKGRSPSCGVDRVAVHCADDPPRNEGRGLFAAALIERFPNLPVEDDDGLSDAAARENWIECVFAYDRLQEFWSERRRIGELVEFHTNHKLILMAHSPDAYRELGRLVAAARSMPRDLLHEHYERPFMAAMRRPATRGRHANVLQHAFGYVRDAMSEDERRALLNDIESFRTGRISRDIPLKRLAQLAHRCNQTYLLRQLYFTPNPRPGLQYGETECDANRSEPS